MLAELLCGYNMSLGIDQLKRLESFFINSKFRQHGAVITDLDGTAVHEVEGKTVIHRNVERGLKKIYDVGRPVVVNTLRFPLSVIRTFGVDWYKISHTPIPVVLLNGSQLGFIAKMDDEFIFEQLVSFPLMKEEINEVLNKVKKFTKEDISNIILFYYPENWEKGEVIWTPDPSRIPHLQQKYPSASTVFSVQLTDLEKESLASPVCMILLLADIPGDRLMAYQHTRRSNFITRRGVTNSFGAEKIAELLKIDLQHSIGAGDTDMDNFLNVVGLSVHVGNSKLSYQGISDTLRLSTFNEFGDLLYKFAEMQQSVLK